MPWTLGYQVTNKAWVLISLHTNHCMKNALEQHIGCLAIVEQSANTRVVLANMDSFRFRRFVFVEFDSENVPKGRTTPETTVVA
jgi:hypothetical protein